MARFISRKNQISTAALKRKQAGDVVRYHAGREVVKFTRTNGGWLREREDVNSESPYVVSSAAVAAECNAAVGCKSSWARVY